MALAATRCRAETVSMHVGVQRLCRDYIGVICRDYLGVMETKMETTTPSPPKNNLCCELGIQDLGLTVWDWRFRI